ncbi:MAG: peptidase M17 [Marinilabiliales bacterium]|nr:MAG: peptidase M17 [Marinilabiliales bacterium]
MISIQKTTRISGKSTKIIVTDNKSDLLSSIQDKNQLNYLQKELKKKKNIIHFNLFSHQLIAVIVSKGNTPKILEEARLAGTKCCSILNNAEQKICQINFLNTTKETSLALIEGIVLKNYQFLKYFSDKKENSLSELKIKCKIISNSDIDLLTASIEGTYFARDLVNEPLSYLTAAKLSEEIKQRSEEAGYAVEIFGKKKIESLKMGGLLAVNKGSIDPPTFTIIEWKPKNAKNKKPLVLVGKGVVFDTGGLSLKPTAGSMDAMKSDMGGAAAVAGTLYSISKAKLPAHVIGLIPATDNRPGQNAYAPQDVIQMFDGTTVEVLNTDAEGRMILADALSYAKKYDPMLTIDLATLTGAASVAVGRIAIAAMRTSNNKLFNALVSSGNNVYERLVELPLWDEYKEQIKSSVADIKNVGGREGGAITAGKFLEHFTDYPWIHLDIAGPAYLDSTDQYRPKGGSGVGVRLLTDFIKNI